MGNSTPEDYPVITKDQKICPAYHFVGGICGLIDLQCPVINGRACYAKGSPGQLVHVNASRESGKLKPVIDRKINESNLTLSIDNQL